MARTKKKNNETLDTVRTVITLPFVVIAAIPLLLLTN